MVASSLTKSPDENIVRFCLELSQGLSEIYDPEGLRRAIYEEIVSAHPDTPKTIEPLVAILEAHACGKEYKINQSVGIFREERGIPRKGNPYSYLGDRAEEVVLKLVEYADQQGWDKIDLPRAYNALTDTAIGKDYPILMEFIERLCEKKGLDLIRDFE
jgi:hypothetical protein